MQLRVCQSIKYIVCAFLASVFSNAAQAEIIAFECAVPDMSRLVFTYYSDGTPARVGVSTGVGNKALTWKDRFGAWVFVEVNTDGSPVTMSTIQTNLEIIHSRHLLLPTGDVLQPSQSKGRCKITKL